MIEKIVVKSYFKGSKRDNELMDKLIDRVKETIEESYNVK